MTTLVRQLDRIFGDILVANRTPAKVLPTGIASLDRLMRGEAGIPMRRLVVISGAPSAGKTALALLLAHRAVRQGHPCAWFAADEEPDTLVDRLAQLEGADPAVIDSGDAAALAPIEDRLREMAARLRIFDQDEGQTAREAEEWLSSEAASGKPGVLVLDSLQTIYADSGDGSAKSRVEAVVAAAKSASKRGHLVIATSEVSRSSYQTTRSASLANPMAASKESGAIEYASKTLIHLRSVKDGPAIAVTVSKNRGGKKGSFQMGLSGVLFHEPSIVAATSQPTVEDDAQRVRAALVAKPDGVGMRELMGMVNMRHERIKASLDRLIGDGVAANAGTPSRPKFRLVA